MAVSFASTHKGVKVRDEMSEPAAARLLYAGTGKKAQLLTLVEIQMPHAGLWVFFKSRCVKKGSKVPC